MLASSSEFLLGYARWKLWYVTSLLHFVPFPLTLSSDQLSSPLADLALSSRVSKKVLCPLLNLPDELIEVVLEYAYGSRFPHDHPHYPFRTGLVLAHKPICRRLWPMQQRILYRRIEIDSYNQLVNIERALVGDRHRDPSERLGSLVRALELSTVNFQDRPSPGGAGDHEAGPGMPELAAKLLATLLGELGRLQSLQVDLKTMFGIDRSTPVEQALLAVVVNDSSTPVKLYGLKSLRISTYGTTLETDLNGATDDLAAWMVQFSRFPDLAYLNIDLETERPPSFNRGASPVRPVLAKLSSLDIYTDFALWHTPLRDVAPNLAEIEIIVRSSSLRPIVRGLPPSLLHLDIEADDDSEVIDDLLPPLFLLQSLSLDGACFTPSRLPTSLAQLRHLESLEFGSTAKLSDILLAQLVQGPTRLEHLRRLQDRVFSVYLPLRGPTLLNKQLVLPGESERDESGVWRGWRAPHWPAGLSEGGFVEVVDAARVHGVLIDSRGLLSLGWRAEYERERDLVAVCRGLSTGDWSDARRFCGDECVEAVLSRQRREGRRSSVGRELELVSGFVRRGAERRRSL
ncbi:hypothetical protein JCM3775_007313 [Rhodotorula graminis]